MGSKGPTGVWPGLNLVFVGRNADSPLGWKQSWDDTS